MSDELEHRKGREGDHECGGNGEGDECVEHWKSFHISEGSLIHPGVGEVYA